MINPSDIRLSSLPWLPLDAKTAFPKNPAIYFAIDSQDKIQYVGRSQNPKTRWANHHKYDELQAIGGIKIAYLFVDSCELLPEIESALISWFDPPLNIFGRRVAGAFDQSPADRIYGVMEVIRQTKVFVPDLAFKIKQCRVKDSRSVQVLATSAGISTAYWYEIEKGKRESISEDVLRGIERALGVDFGVKFDD